MIAGAEGHFRRDGNNFTLWVGKAQRFDFCRVGFGGEQDRIAHLDWPGRDRRLLPVGFSELADAAAELLGDRESLGLGLTKKPQADFSPKDAARPQGRGCDLNKSPKGEGPSKEGDEQA